MTKVNAQRARQMGCGLSVCFLLVHVTMLLLFRQYGVTPMVRFNAFSIVFYLLSFLMLRTGYLWLYTVSVYLEVLLHMTLAVYFTGTEGGFHVTLIAMSTLVFYAEYLSKNLNTRHVPGIALTAVGMLAYLGCIVCSRVHTPAYRLPEDVCFWLQIMWGIICFVVNIFFLTTTDADKTNDIVCTGTYGIIAQRDARVGSRLTENGDVVLDGYIALHGDNTTYVEYDDAVGFADSITKRARTTVVQVGHVYYLTTTSTSRISSVTFCTRECGNLFLCYGHD